MTWDVKIKKWHAVAAWTWDAGDDVCGICRMPFDGCPPNGKRMSPILLRAAYCLLASWHEPSPATCCSAACTHAALSCLES